MVSVDDQWADIELRHLRTLRAIARAGSFHEAADDLDYAQSAISQHLAALEAIVGQRLVDRGRGRRRVELTEAGTILLGHAQAVFARLGAARADLHAYAAGAAGSLRVGMYQSVGARILPEVISRFARSWPAIDVRLTETNEDVRPVESGELDLAFTVLPLPEGPYGWADLLPAPSVLRAAADAPLVCREAAPTLAEIAAEPLIGFASTSPSTRIAESTLRAHGLEPRVVFRSDDNGTVQGLVAAGFGIAVIPALVVDADDPRVATRPVDVPARTIAIAWHAERRPSAAAEAFVAVAREVCAELSSR